MDNTKEKSSIVVQAGKYELMVDHSLFPEIKPVLDDYKKVLSENKALKEPKTIKLDEKEVNIDEGILILKNQVEKLKGEKEALQAICDEKAEFISKDELDTRLDLILMVADSLKVKPSELKEHSKVELMKKVIEAKLPEVKLDGLEGERLEGVFCVAKSVKESVQSATKVKEETEKTLTKDAKIQKDSVEFPPIFTPDNRAKAYNYGGN